MKITGKYYADDNFICLFKNATMYTIARNTGDWGRVTVGGYTAYGQKVTQADFDRWIANADQEGTFELAE